MTDATIPEKIAQNTLLQAVARVAMAATLPLLLMGTGYVAAMGDTVNKHTTSIALLQQAQVDMMQRIQIYDTQAGALATVLGTLKTDIETTKRDVGYLRDWVEELRRRERAAALETDL